MPTTDQGRDANAKLHSDIESPLHELASYIRLAVNTGNVFLGERLEDAKQREAEEVALDRMLHLIRDKMDAIMGIIETGTAPANH